MKKVSELTFGYRDAENYKTREQREFFSKIFLRTPELDRLCMQDIYFLVGEKGTGKTAYAVYLSNMEYQNNVASLRFIRETEYDKFVSLKTTKHLTLSDYTDIWKVIIYLLLAQQIKSKESKNPIFERFGKFNKLSRAIDEYYQKAFSPEIVYAIQFAEEAKVAAEIISKHFGIEAGISGENKSVISFSESRYQLNLLYIQKQFEEALGSLKLDRNYILFIDGIDIRPSRIEYQDYSECVKGLANAVWSVNSDFFANIKDSKGRLRVVLLIRPDIFNSLGLQNQNSKIRDNAVVLNWVTSYHDYRTSAIFQMTDHLMGWQNSMELPHGMAWAYYFPYDSRRVRSQQQSPSSFITFLRYSLYRPRDIVTILMIQRENLIEQGRAETDLFSLSDFEDPAFTRKYSDYLLGEVKDHLLFYYSPREYELFLKFFQFLNGKSQFSYQQFLDAYQVYNEFMERNAISKPEFCTTPDNFLQFLYDLNVIGYVVDTANERFFGWCYRERSPSNIAPKVRTGVRYDVHYGLMKALA